MVLGLNDVLTKAKGLNKPIVGASETLCQAKLNVEFMMFDSTLPYDVIMGQPYCLTSKQSCPCTITHSNFPYLMV